MRREIPPPVTIFGTPYTREFYKWWRAHKTAGQSKLMEELDLIEKRREEILGTLRLLAKDAPP